MSVGDTLMAILLAILIFAVGTVVVFLAKKELRESDDVDVDPLKYGYFDSDGQYHPYPIAPSEYEPDLPYDIEKDPVRPDEVFGPLMKKDEK